MTTSTELNPSEKMQKIHQLESNDSDDDNIPLSVLKKAIEENKEPSTSPKSVCPIKNIDLQDEVPPGPREQTPDQPEAVDPFECSDSKTDSVRKKKKDAKESSQENPEVIASAEFDLQQVISLPRSNESGIFYSRRLSVLNLTIYNLVNKNCLCYLWNEINSKRWSNEISTCVANYLIQLDTRE
ncbi:unnamed protein product [Acanthoscelides obtectus]|uniref:Uncharacterized protein n=1 Tax=Acanthoscelides obtectus TaxID=200917 RepID=A0A9P0P1Y6_ACAOB|nr:unnamed protein product [Acanthoscelides obtectus]CAK1646229.1 hypothetical protein AOBTE_LOCUS14518 [Acanthoscelides obtectus]